MCSSDLLDDAIITLPSVGKKWMLITPDENDYQNMGVVSSIWSKPGDPNYILAGTESSGLWKTTNGGLNWYNITDSYTGPNGAPNGFLYHYPFGVVSIAVKPTDDNVILIAATIPYGLDVFGSNGIGILKSLDGGNSWTKTNLFYTANSNNNVGLYAGITKILFDPIDPNIVFAIGGLKLYFSSNLFDTFVVGLDAKATGSPLSQSPLSQSVEYQKLKFRDIEILDIYESTFTQDRKIFISTDSYNNISAQLIVGHIQSFSMMPFTWTNITNSLWSVISS